MAAADTERLVDLIDRLMTEYLAEREKTATGNLVTGSDIDIESIIEHGVYPPNDPTTPSRLALYSIGETLGLVGGADLMHQVYDAYEGKHGASKANSLSARWDTAANLWHY